MARTLVPSAYTRPTVNIEPRPEIGIEPVVAKEASVRCNSTPRGAKVTVQSAEARHAAELGITPLTAKLKPNESFLLRFTKDGYLPAEKNVRLEPGETRTINVILQQTTPEIIPVLSPAKLVCDSYPSGADVTVAASGISSYYGGKTPVTLKLEPNIAYSITFKREYFTPVTKTFTLNPGEVRMVNIKFPAPIPPPPPTTPDIEPEPIPEPDIPPEIEPTPEPYPPTPPEPPEPSPQKLDALTFVLPSQCVIGDVCRGSIELQNNTTEPLTGAINVDMEGAVPVSPIAYNIAAGDIETIEFGIPTDGLTITGVYVLDLALIVNDEVVETQTGRVEILPPPEHEVTFTAEPSTATINVETL